MQRFHKLCVLIATLLIIASCQSSVPPLFYIPGMTVSLLQVDIDANLAQHLPSACKHHGPIVAWLNPLLYLNPFKDFCIYHYLRMDFNNITGEFTSPKGITVNTINFGYANSTISGIPFAQSVTTNLFKFLEKEFGYEFGNNMFACPYDWRMSPKSILTKTLFKKQLMQKIEISVENYKKKALLLSHSNGGTLTYEFLQSVTDEWKAKYIQASVFVSANWVGQFNTFRDVTVSNGWSLPLLLYSRELNSKLIRSIEVAAWCMPNLYFFANEFYFSMQSKNYTVNETITYFHQNLPHESFEALLYNWKRIAKPEFAYPNIKVYNLYGTGVKTEVTYHYKESVDILKHEPSSCGYDANGDGDQGYIDNSAVNKAWQKYDTFSHHEFEGLKHSSELGAPALHAKLQEIIKENA